MSATEIRALQSAIAPASRLASVDVAIKVAKLLPSVLARGRYGHIAAVRTSVESVFSHARFNSTPYATRITGITLTITNLRYGTKRAEISSKYTNSFKC